MEDRETRDLVSIPYFVHEGDMDRADRTNKRLTVALVLTIVLMFLSNGIWLYEWMQYDYVSEDEETVTTTYEQDGSGTNIMGNHNEVNNGTTNDHDSDEADNEIEDPEIVQWK